MPYKIKSLILLILFADNFFVLSYNVLVFIFIVFEEEKKIVTFLDPRQSASLCLICCCVPVAHMCTFKMQSDINSYPSVASPEQHFYRRQGTLIRAKNTVIKLCHCQPCALTTVELVPSGKISDVLLACSELLLKHLSNFSSHTASCALPCRSIRKSGQERCCAVLLYYVVSLKVHRAHWSNSFHFWSKEAIWKIIR